MMLLLSKKNSRENRTDFREIHTWTGPLATIHLWGFTRLCFISMGSAGCPRGDVSQRDLSAVYLFSPVSVRAEGEGGRYQGVDRYLNFVL